MSSRPFVQAAILALICVPQCCFSQRSRAPLGENFPLEEGFTVTSDVTYTTGMKGPLQADVYVPHGTGPFAGIVFIHGGGWVSGNRNQMISLIKALAEDGYVCFTIEYDLGQATYPHSLEESMAAVKFFREHAAEYHLDPARIAVAGSSAGGELAALVALAQGDAASRVQAAMILNGVLDLTQRDDKATAASPVTTYLGGECKTLKEACRAASPRYQVHAGAPPFYVGHGTADQMVSFAQATAFVDALKQAGVPVEFYQAADGKHTYWADPRFYQINLENMKAFLRQQFGAPSR